MRTLRTKLGTHLRSQKKTAVSGAPGGKRKKPWRFLESLAFLQPYILPRSTATNLGLELAEDVWRASTD